MDAAKSKEKAQKTRAKYVSDFVSQKITIHDIVKDAREDHHLKVLKLRVLVEALEPEWTKTQVRSVLQRGGFSNESSISDLRATTIDAAEQVFRLAAPWKHHANIPDGWPWFDKRDYLEELVETARSRKTFSKRKVSSEELAIDDIPEPEDLDDDIDFSDIPDPE